MARYKHIDRNPRFILAGLQSRYGFQSRHRKSLPFKPIVRHTRCMKFHSNLFAENFQFLLVAGVFIQLRFIV